MSWRSHLVYREPSKIPYSSFVSLGNDGAYRTKQCRHPQERGTSELGISLSEQINSTGYLLNSRK
ncbi:hypothetical protein VCR3J2_250053 [Vibrio coralliirubri]|nr:hypothetical protein VCR3J2_250053 [Vibrio coralliirubri]